MRTKRDACLLTALPLSPACSYMAVMLSRELYDFAMEVLDDDGNGQVRPSEMTCIAAGCSSKRITPAMRDAVLG